MEPKEMIDFRVSNKLSQKDLGELLGVTYQAVIFWEKGQRPIPKTIVRLIKLFIKFPQLMKEY